MNKKLFLVGLLSMATAVYAGSYKDGTYRGSFVDGAENQVTVEYKLKDDVVTSAKFRHLFYKGDDYLKNASLEKMKEQYNALLKYSVGKNVDEAMKKMYTPGEIEMAGATIRATKVRSAIKDGLLHDVYTPAK